VVQLALPFENSRLNTLDLRNSSGLKVAVQIVFVSNRQRCVGTQVVLMGNLAAKVWVRVSHSSWD